MSKTMTRKYNKKTGTERIEKFYPNGQLKMSGDFKNGIPAGEIKEYTENGIMTGHHNLTNDSTAFYKEWLPNGVKILDCLFVDEKTEKSVRFFPDGSLESIEHYVDKKLHGLCVYYFAGNPEKVKIRANFENDERHGTFEEYYPNGNIKVRSPVEQRKTNRSSRGMDGRWKSS